MKSFTVKTDCSLKDFTDAAYPQGSFCLAALLRGKDIKVNGARVNSNVFLKSGDTVNYYTNPKQESLKSHYKVYEDENVLVADKLSGVTAEGLLSELLQNGEYYAVHRLDRNTQGLIVFAKNRGAEEELTAAFKKRRVGKKYIALCKNGFKQKIGILTAYLVKDEKAAEVKIFKNETAGSVKIVTEYEVKENRGDIALIRIALHTGKTHQIRAHMAFIGCPVLGDEKYGDSALNKKYNAARQRLVAKELCFDLNGKLEYLNAKEFVSSFEL